MKKYLLLGVALVAVCVSGIRIAYLKEETKSINPVNKWVTSFTDKDYTLCDNYVGGIKDKLLAKDTSLYGSNPESEEMYINMLDACVDNIKSINVTMKGTKKAVLEVTYQKYEKVDTVTVNEESLEAVKAKYINNEMSDDELISSLNDLYNEAFKNTVSANKDSKEEVNEYEVTIAGSKLMGVRDLVVDLLNNMRLTHNTEVFEKDINSTVNVILRK